MFNRERTKEVFGYDIDITKRRRTAMEIANAPKVDKKTQLLVIDNCPVCNKEKQVKLRQSVKNRPCSKCFHNSEEMLKVKQNNHYERSEETKQKMKENNWSKRGGISPFKGKRHTEEAKRIIADKTKKQNKDLLIKLGKDAYAKRMACISRDISEDEFNGFISTDNQRARGLPEYKKWEKAVFSKYHNKCDICGTSSSSLTPHHLYNFSSHVDKRHDIDNGVLLCHTCHDAFHNKYSRKNNTPQQYLEFKAFLTPTIQKPIVYVVAGIAGSGKSWVCRQLTHKFNYVSYDEVSKSDHIDMLRNPKDPTKPSLYDPNIKISTFFTRHSHEFDIRLIVILGDFLKVKQQLKSRGGTITKSTYRRWKVMQARMRKYGTFSGDSDDVLKYLKSIN